MGRLPIWILPRPRRHTRTLTCLYSIPKQTYRQSICAYYCISLAGLLFRLMGWTGPDFICKPILYLRSNSLQYRDEPIGLYSDDNTSRSTVKFAICLLLKRIPCKMFYKTYCIIITNNLQYSYCCFVHTVSKCSELIVKVRLNTFYANLSQRRRVGMRRIVEHCVPRFA